MSAYLTMTPYIPVTDFSADEAAGGGGRSTVDTSGLDAELAALKTVTDNLIHNLELIQRSDGLITDKYIHPFNLSNDLTALMIADINPKGLWTTATVYKLKDVVRESSRSYLAAEDHTSGVFATDLANNKWLTLSQTDAEIKIAYENNSAFALDGPVTINASLSDANFTVASLLNAFMLHVDAGNNSVHIDNNLLTGANDGDLVMAHNKFIRWINNAGTTSENYGIRSSLTDDLQFHIPEAADFFTFLWANAGTFFLQNQNGGPGILFGAESTADHAAPVANRLVLYIKDLGGFTHLYARNDTTIFQMTHSTVTQAEAEAGTATSRRMWTSQRVKQAAIAAGIPSGTVMLFFQTAAPTGWTEVTTQNDKAVRIVSGAGGGTGGSVAFETAFANKSVTGTNVATGLSTAQLASHSHIQTVKNAVSGSLERIDTRTDITSQKNLTATATAGSGSTHNHTFNGTAIDLNVNFINCKLASKNA